MRRGSQFAGNIIAALELDGTVVAPFSSRGVLRTPAAVLLS
jgi:hypothetical protein